MCSHGNSEEPKNPEGPTNHMAKITETEGNTKGYWGAREERWTQGNGNTWFGEAAQHKTRRVTNCRGRAQNNGKAKDQQIQRIHKTQAQSMSRTKYDAGRKNAEGRCEHRAQRKGWGRNQKKCQDDINVRHRDPQGRSQHMAQYYTGDAVVGVDRNTEFVYAVPRNQRSVTYSRSTITTEKSRICMGQGLAGPNNRQIQRRTKNNVGPNRSRMYRARFNIGHKEAHCGNQRRAQGNTGDSVVC
ncbi:hypothetical protein DFH28DRAFT_938758 [Melampsora americana]|nr:hypothetical protein DFH28DRAFT_938758 [Melampsora americana]